MSRLTITLTELRYRALKQASAKRGKTIGELIEESLEFYGIKGEQEAKDLIRRARANANLEESQALKLATAETRTARRS